MRCLVIARRLIHQISGDRRTLALLLVVPVFILFILHVVLTSGATRATIDVVNAAGADLQPLRENADVVVWAEEDEALGDLRAGRADACLIVEEGGDRLTIEGSDPAVAALVKGAYGKFAAARAADAVEAQLRSVADNLNKLPAGLKGQVKLPELSHEQPEPQIDYLYGDGFEFFDTAAAGLMGFIVFFLVFLLSGISFLRERISGTLERVLASPVRRWEIVAGYLLGFGLFVVVQTLIIQSFLLYGLRIRFIGGFGAILAVNLLSAAGSLALGTLLSAFARNEFQLFQFIPVIIIPQVLFSGLFDLRAAPGWVHWLSRVFPLTYTADALKNIMVRGKGLGDVAVDLAVLAGFTLLFAALNILALKRYRRI